jgi:hypothetical protein
MKGMRVLGIAWVLGLTATPAAAQKPAILMTKVRTLVDQDGRGFTRAPVSVVPIGGGRYAMQEENELPLVVDSTGKLIKRFGRGGGPGEFEFTGTGMSTGSGDTLYIGNQQSMNVFAPDLGFVRSVPFTSIYAGTVLPTADGFVAIAQKTEGAHMTSVHVVDRDGKIVRSFVRDTVDRKTWPSPSYRVSRSSDGGLWVASIFKHRVEKWTMDGRKVGTIDSVPKWFMLDRNNMDGKSNVLGAREASGVLWVMSNVPVENYREIMTKVVGVGREVDGRKIPTEQMWKAYIEAYDPKTGALLAQQALNVYGVGMIGANQLVVYRPGSNDEAQLEIWSLALKR